ncbi:MAG: hypothetical protein K2N19_05165, partial [Muribaculaceae bacterium]|nr:hypothetical protein [Muribaculaceae bacterium]
FCSTLGLILAIKAARLQLKKRQKSGSKRFIQAHPESKKDSSKDSANHSPRRKAGLRARSHKNANDGAAHSPNTRQSFSGREGLCIEDIFVLYNLIFFK